MTVYINSSSEYQAVLIRHGKNNDLVEDLGIFLPCIQQVPDDFFVENGLTWNVSFEYTIPDSSIPGLYSLKLIPRIKYIHPYYLTFIVSTKPLTMGKNPGCWCCSVQITGRHIISGAAEAGIGILNICNPKARATLYVLYGLNTCLSL